GRLDGILFGERQSRIVVSAAPQMEDVLMSAGKKHNVPVTRLGTVTQETISWMINGKKVIDLPVRESTQNWKGEIERMLS
ncbi:hypothetical protein RZS08_18115, partial [Arthrospira platensis SPKY1]|nr:hypothetical protein [Arthrospira platensis SPKY1]